MSNCKWVVVMSIEEYRDALNELFFKSGITVFSEVQVKGFRFSKSQISHDLPPLTMDPVYSVVSFALTEEEHAAALLKAIENFNQSNERARAIHAFQINVEDYI